MGVALSVSSLSCLMAAGQLPVILNQEYRVKLGRSFTFPKENSFHTIKCNGEKICLIPYFILFLSQMTSNQNQLIQHNLGD